MSGTGGTRDTGGDDRVTNLTPRLRPRIEDVANAAGVSVATVSRALRNLPNVAPSTRDRVHSIADELGYRPDPAASRLAAGRTKTIAIAVPAVSSWYFSQVIGGAEAVLAEAGYDMLVMTVSGDDARKRFLRDALTMNRRVDGMILADLRIPDDEAADLSASDIRVVTIGFQTEAISSVMLDDVAVGEVATNHLLELGHRRIGLIEGLTDDALRFAVPERRRSGYEAALASHGVATDDSLVASGNFSVDGGCEAMADLLHHSEPPTAVFAMSDEMAMGAMKTARDAGLDVPGDLSIIGVDDHEIASVVNLTTIRQAVPANGAIAARWIVEDLRLDGCEVRTEQPPTELVVRGTTQPR